MPPELSAISAAFWLWDKSAPYLAKTSAKALQKKWAQFKWIEAETLYRERLFNQTNKIRLLGNPKPIEIETIYTDVHVLDELSAFQKFDLSALEGTAERAVDPPTKRARTRADDLLKVHSRLYLLGKPGAGKTTFLKHLALQACKGQIDKTPIFVSLKEWSDSGEALDDFVANEFRICGFPSAKDFINHILEKGKGLVLFDGLDEINQEGVDKHKMILSLERMIKQYPDSAFCVTCRIAASEYSFDASFKYVEVADFDNEQQLTFIDKWYHQSFDRKQRFVAEWQKQESAGFRELAATPLLLTLICLAFDDSLSFPKRRVELYKEALEALLRKWDSSRGVFRSETYRRLSIDRKVQLLSRLAATNFEAGQYLLPKETVLTEISRYLADLPPDDIASPSSEEVLTAIEAQHGLVVERARNIYSFSHLTLQEYFTARHIIENQISGTLDRLIANANDHKRWREVFLMTASMLGDASSLLEGFAQRASEKLQSSPRVMMLIHNLAHSKSQVPIDLLANSSFTSSKHAENYSDLANPFAIENLQEAIHTLVGELGVGHYGDASGALSRSRELSRVFVNARSSRAHGPMEKLAKKILEDTNDFYCLLNYLESCQLMVEALRLSTLKQRKAVENMVLRSN